MNVLDENIVKSQRQLLRSWRVSFRHISEDLGRGGIDDENIIPLLHQLRRPTFFTSDSDFYRRRLCHARYCIIYLAVEEDETATYIRRLLRPWSFDTEAKRMGAVVQVSLGGLLVWRLHEGKTLELAWGKS